MSLYLDSHTILSCLFAAAKALLFLKSYRGMTDESQQQDWGRLEACPNYSTTNDPQGLIYTKTGDTGSYGYWSLRDCRKERQHQ